MSIKWDVVISAFLCGVTLGVAAIEIWDVESFGKQVTVALGSVFLVAAFYGGILE